MNLEEIQEQIPYTQLYERWIKQKARAEKAEAVFAAVDEGIKDIEAIRAAGKPCHMLKYCPYGSLVEDFEFSESEKSCKVFGHDCLVYTRAESLTEELSADYRRTK